MPRPDKVEKVKQIAADLQTTDVYYIVDYRGLTHSEARELRARLVKADAKLKVVKNTLTKLAAVDAGVEELTELLQGPTAIAYCYGDPVRVAKTIQDFIKDTKKAAIRGGKLQRSILTASEVERLATLPSREQLIGQLVGLVSTPLTGLVGVLNNPIRSLVLVLGQVQDQRASAA